MRLKLFTPEERVLYHISRDGGAASARYILNKALGIRRIEKEIANRMMEALMPASPLTRLKEGGFWTIASPYLDTPLAEIPFCSLDVEVTHSSPEVGGVIEIGAWRFRIGDEGRSFGSLVNPNQNIPAFITRLTGITSKDVSGYPSFEWILHTVYDLFQDAIILTHDGRIEADYIFYYLKRLTGSADPLLFMDTQQLARRFIQGSPRMNLGDLLKRLNLEAGRPHRALDDAVGIGKAFGKIVNQEELAGRTLRELLLLKSK